MDAIPKDVLMFARLATARRAAAMLLTALAESGLACTQLDAKLGAKPGFTEAYILGLMNGSVKDTDFVSDLCCGLDVDLRFGFERIPFRRASPVEPHTEETA